MSTLSDLDTDPFTAERYHAADTDPARGAPPLVARLATGSGAHWVDASGLDAFLARGGEQVLFFHGDPVRFPEVLDVAVVLPELCRHAQRQFGHGYDIGVVARHDEDAIARRFGVTHWPALVFLRDGRWVDTLSGMQDWDVYQQRLQAVAAKPASRPPIAIQASGQGAPGCH